MDRRYGALLSFQVILIWLLLLGACAVEAHASYMQQRETLEPFMVGCDASSPTVRAGQSVTLTARVQGVSARLVYSFSSDKGKLSANGQTARLDTAGLSPGTVIRATCQFIDQSGRRSSHDVTVRVVEAPILQAWGVSSATATTTSSTTASSQTASEGRQTSMSGIAMPAAKPAQEASAAEPSQRAEKTTSKMGSFGNITGSTSTASRAEAAAVPSSPSEKSEARSQPIETKQPPQVLADLSTEKASAPKAPQAEAATAPPDSGDVYQQAEKVQQWKQKLKNGKIEYLLPAQMKLHETSSVRVVVHGFEDVGGVRLPGAKSDALKVSPRMQVQLSADENPGEFEISPKDGEIQFVPIDGAATWMWNVTPKQPAQDQKLTIRALLVYPDKGQQIEQEVTSYTAVVSVSVPGFWEALRETFWSDPKAAMKYVLPGGAGFTAFAGVVVWWWRRRHPSKASSEAEQDD